MRFDPLGLLLAGLLILPYEARAASPPQGPAAPTLVTYHILNQQDQVPPDFTVLFAPGARAARISFAGQTGYMLVDADRHQLTMVMEQPAISVVIPTPKLFAPYFEWRDTVEFTRGPAGFAAGQACNYWIADNAKGNGRICFSDDGVPLRIEAEGKKASHTDIEAVSVQTEPYDPAQFEVPADHPPLEFKGLNLSPFGGNR